MDPETIKLVAQLTSLLVSMLALVIGLRSEARNLKRFNIQIEQSRKAAEAAARPLLDIGREGYADETALTISNHGPGVAIVREIKFIRGTRHATRISDLLTLSDDHDIVWIENTQFATPYYLSGKSSEDAFRINVDRLQESGVPKTRLEHLISDIDAQLDKIAVHIEYEDVFGNKFALRDTPD